MQLSAHHHPINHLELVTTMIPLCSPLAVVALMVATVNADYIDSALI